jgi:hypothetical protein
MNYDALEPELADERAGIHLGSLVTDHDVDVARSI